MKDDIARQILQLEEARKHVLADAHHYSAIIPGILPIIGSAAALDIRRWGADFLAEGFAGPTLPAPAKEALGVKVLPLLKEWLDSPGQDEAVVKSAIQAAASVYPLVFRYIAKNDNDSQPWDMMSAIKLNVLRRWDSASTGIRVCCIKFVQRVVHAQTPGVIMDPRRPDQSDISVSIVPRDHRLIPPVNLEAEASGLLDRLLNVFFEEQSHPILIDATLNCLTLLIRSRQSIANKIISVVLNFNPLKNARAATMGPRERIVLRSLERNTRLFLMNICRRNESSPYAQRIRQHVDRMLAIQMEVFDESASRKRGPPDGAAADGLDPAKRARLAPGLRGGAPTPLPPGPVSFSQLYTLTGDPGLRAFDVTPIPLDMVVRIILAVLQHLDSIQLDEALHHVRARYVELSHRAPPQAAVGAAGAEDDYEPEFEPAEDAEQVANKLDMAPSDAADGSRAPSPDLAIGTFRLPQPPPMTPDEAAKLGAGCITRVLSMMNQLEEPDKSPKPGLHRLAGSRYDKDAWVTILTRLATRTQPDFIDSEEDGEGANEASQVAAKGKPFADGIRETLWKYVVDDFRQRIDVAISWLNEEWYNDRVTARAAQESDVGESRALRMARTANYEKWTLRLLDAIIPYLDAGDKLLIRLLSEIPEVTEAVMTRVKDMANDPDRISLTVKAIYYLAAYKPPAKDMATDALEDLWRNYAGAKSLVRPLLSRVRPSVLVESEQNTPRETPPAPASSSMTIDTSTPSQNSPPLKTVASPSTVTAAG